MTLLRVVRLLVHGARGRMGARIIALAAEDRRFVVAAALDLGDALPASAEARRFDVVIDFSSDAGARNAAELARSRSAALLVGTTGLGPRTLEVLAATAETCAVMIAPNTSLGVAALAHLAAEAARLLGPAFDIDVIERHHTMKKDAPSGTALRLVAALRERAGRDVPAARVHAIRAGDIVGEHVIEFAGPGECVRIAHHATSRDLFARGALRAAEWLIDQPPGRYTIEDSLGLKRS